MTSIMHFLPTCRGAQSSFLPVLGNTALKATSKETSLTVLSVWFETPGDMGRARGGVGKAVNPNSKAANPCYQANDVR